MSKEVRTFCQRSSSNRVCRTYHRQPQELSSNVCARGEIGTLRAYALGALRFAKNATLNLTPFEAHHGREANIVLRNLTKKPPLRNLNWENVLRSKSACLDERDPDAQSMPQPIDTNWGDRSDTEYDIKNRRHPMRLADDRITNQDTEPGINRTTDVPATVTPPLVVMQRTVDGRAKPK